MIFITIKSFFIIMDRFIRQFILFNFIFIMAIDNTNSNNDDDHLFIWKTDPSIYNRWLPPDNINNQPINVNISIFLFGVANIYESNNVMFSSFHLFFYSIVFLSKQISGISFRFTITNILAG